MRVIKDDCRQLVVERKVYKQRDSGVPSQLQVSTGVRWFSDRGWQKHGVFMNCTLWRLHCHKLLRELHYLSSDSVEAALSHDATIVVISIPNCGCCTVKICYESCIIYHQTVEAVLSQEAMRVVLSIVKLWRLYCHTSCIIFHQTVESVLSRDARVLLVGIMRVCDCCNATGYSESCIFNGLKSIKPIDQPSDTIK
ncbi:hypothetical protein RRG08_006178 [Elysia crispata]|uniref:Uncharacterized protein n=1 Tax=Elysia crispata TaxID=231223 RepID=A0AAE0Z474_9GAST|nr:hypothetical protein RRG08_006178 [Elysia crispata]